MALKGEVSSADLVEIRESALGAADPLGIASELADAVAAGRLADPGDAGAALVLAAEIAESRSKHDAALRYVDRALEAYDKRDDSEVAAARALRARILFRVGRADEAVAELEPLRPLLTQHPDAAAYVTAALNVGGRNREAEEWLTEAVNATLAERKERNETTEPVNADDAGTLFFLLQQRHRIRHVLGRSHDAHDSLAERLETRLANATARASAEPAADELLFWPKGEFEQVVKLTTAYGENWDEHRGRLERDLVRLAGAGQSGLALHSGSAAGLTGFAGADGDPDDAETRAGYARQVAAMPGQISWPPERNGPCWCGSGNKYKKCCLPRSR